MRSIGIPQVQELTAGANAYPGILASLPKDTHHPTILFYGHFDVQPQGNEADWASPPFKLTQRGDFLFGRGVTDSKGHNLALLFALEELIKNQTPLKYNVKIFFEANEETGGRGLEHMLTQNKSQFSSNFIVGLDAEMPRKMQPAIYHTTKGVSHFTLSVLGGDREFHSGYFGAIVYNPAIELARYLASLTNKSGQVSIPGVAKVVKKPNHEELLSYKALNLKPRELFAPGDNAPIRKGVPTLILQNAFEPTLDVHGIQVGNVDQMKTAIPQKATATFSLRTVANLTPNHVEKCIKKHTESFFKPFGIRYTLIQDAAISYAYTNPHSPEVKMVGHSLKEVFGHKTILKRFSATQPAASIMQKILKRPFILTGFGIPEDNAHAANERLYIPHFIKGQEFVKHFLTH
ncbi:MAG: M20/M25/M40 family metallo-hydrolase [Candidatus Chisholmbacteria bacterium]|nr:M20/M25/M40 family metallo-hydrolase [Candidatus Chisholmbacteria bacterium]